jgi:hypothetical protein
MPNPVYDHVDKAVKPSTSETMYKFRERSRESCNIVAFVRSARNPHQNRLLARECTVGVGKGNVATNQLIT